MIKMSNKIAKRLRQQNLDGITYRAKGNEVIKYEKGKVPKKIDDALYIAIENIIIYDNKK